MSKPEVFITFRVTQDEKDLLKEYCEQESRNQTEVLRERVSVGLNGESENQSIKSCPKGQGFRPNFPVKCLTKP